MNLYTTEELENIKKTSETNDKIEEFFNNKRLEWKTNIDPLFSLLKDNFTIERKDKIIEIQSLSLSYRQIINEEISLFLNKRSKEDVKIKKLKQEKFVFYATGSGLKTNLGEKSMLIDAHIAENERSLQLIDVHIDFLRSSSKSLESLGFAIKNIIELFNYLK